MKNRAGWALVLGMLGPASVAIPASSAQRQPSKPAAGSALLGRRGFPQSRPDWRLEPWTNEDKAFRTIRVGIEAAWAANKIAQADLGEYQRQHESEHEDAEALFRWAYACYEARRQQPPVKPAVTPGP